MEQVKPRGKGKIGKTLGLKESFKEFDKTQVPGSMFHVDYKTYRKICEEFNKRSVNKILLEAGQLELPHKLGEIRIQKKKMLFDTKFMKIDWKSTKEQGHVVYHMNDSRDNYRYRWYWKKKRAIVKNKIFYSFTPSRANKRELARLLQTSNNIDYFE